MHLNISNLGGVCFGWGPVGVRRSAAPVRKGSIFAVCKTDQRHEVVQQERFRVFEWVEIVLNGSKVSGGGEGVPVSFG